VQTQQREAVTTLDVVHRDVAHRVLHRARGAQREFEINAPSSIRLRSRGLAFSASAMRLSRAAHLTSGRRPAPGLPANRSRCGMPGTSVRAPFFARLHGEIDMDRKPELVALVADYREGAAADAAVDLSDVTFLDSSGVGGLVALVKAARERDGAVAW
jgi:hypothetical protein